jgi:predicted homoserine dehydrogenase-like protein
MRILVVGAGRTGARVIEQLKKNPGIEIVTADPREEHYAVEAGVIEAVDIREALTPLNLDQILDQVRPAVVLLATETEDMGLGEAPGVDILADALQDELAAISKVPVIEVARSGR